MILLIGMSAFFSSTETAFTSFNHARVKALARSGNKRARLAIELSDKYDKLLSSILIGNNIVNILASSLATVVFVAWLGGAGVSVSTVVMTVLVLIFGEISPKTLAKDHADQLVLAFAPYINFIMLLLTPLNWIFAQWRKLLALVFPAPKDEGMAEEELLTLVAEAEQEGEIDEHESDLIRSAIEFNDQTAEDILTHRVDIVALDVEMTMDEAEQVFHENTFSRLPVYEDSIDSIVGVIHEKDFFNNRTATSLREIMKPPLFVTPTSRISDLLHTLQKAKSHMAIVSDEYGGTMGIVTMEDIIEELVGEIYDEHDQVVESFKKLPDGSYLIDCTASLRDMQELFAIQGDFDAATVGGWVLDQMGRIPAVGDTFVYDNRLSVRVTRVESTRVLEISVHQLDGAAEQTA
ncbi:MAG: hemolysin family protein [Clostridiales bacterium]|nr:hemolysin family protein [Clostridiales bacterium]MDY2871052.1 hemolysin family protein [Eubacteriales bacterium]